MSTAAQFSDDPKKQRILESALHEFAENGYSEASTRKIAARAGVAHGLMYYYFKDKKALFLELCRLVREKITSSVMEGADTGDVFDALLRVCENKLRFFAAHPAMYKVAADEMRVFPREFMADGKAMRKDASFWNVHKQRKSRCGLELEILESALGGMSDRLMDRFYAGEIAADEMLREGIQKAERYIEFFRRTTR